MNPLVPEGMIEGWKIVRPDLRTRNGYRWPWPGNWAECDNEHPFTVGDACPQFEGDGLCIAKTWKGAASGGYPAVTALLLAYWADDVLGEDDNKIRVGRALVLDVFGPQQLIRDGWCVGADLRGANLRYAELHGANLSGARGADTSGAIL